MEGDKYIYNLRWWQFQNYFMYWSANSGQSWYSRDVMKWAVRSYWNQIVGIKLHADGNGGWYVSDRLSRIVDILKFW
jgi:hypothetical protein